MPLKILGSGVTLVTYFAVVLMCFEPGISPLVVGFCRRGLESFRVVCPSSLGSLGLLLMLSFRVVLDSLCAAATARLLATTPHLLCDLDPLCVGEVKVSTDRIHKCGMRTETLVLEILMLEQTEVGVDAKPVGSSRVDHSEEERKRRFNGIEEETELGCET